MFWKDAPDVLSWAKEAMEDPDILEDAVDNLEEDTLGSVCDISPQSPMGSGSGDAALSVSFLRGRMLVLFKEWMLPLRGALLPL